MIIDEVTNGFADVLSNVFHHHRKEAERLSSILGEMSGTIEDQCAAIVRRYLDLVADKDIDKLVDLWCEYNGYEEWRASQTRITERDSEPQCGARDPAVDHPAHYNVGKIEVIDVIEDAGWGRAFNLGNAVKYILRAEHKGKELQDLKKARWYLDRYIQKLEEK